MAEEVGPEIVVGVVTGSGEGADEDGDAEGEGGGNPWTEGAETGDALGFEAEGQEEVDGWEGEEGEKSEDGMGGQEVEHCMGGVFFFFFFFFLNRNFGTFFKR